ncbi:unnamed protein product [Didymodactylos carnosus]|uniref:Uncharacterized protein n=1 Tax=Didymodactylos carnosus TaxID=1234261 RepID=A0A814VKP7_9BILA|nr:unnamed protein product [Didymodactylos carnosus]CAF1216241.1 unnamed protein product [Didymodactylos carnosus]CAF3953940.1 unnamed protein product [Didymodactylos carnosus]CAF4024749.1 unnamed protein product [Didymodactylos carnosus]
MKCCEKEKEFCLYILCVTCRQSVSSLTNFPQLRIKTKVDKASSAPARSSGSRLEEAAVAATNNSTNNFNTPILFSIFYAGFDSIVILVQLVCENGSTNATSVCPDFQSFVVIFYSSTTNETTALLIPRSIANCELYSDATDSHIINDCPVFQLDTSNILCRFSLTLPSAYVPYLISIRTQFTDGTQSNDTTYTSLVKSDLILTPELLNKLYNVDHENTYHKFNRQATNLLYYFNDYFSPTDFELFSDIYGKNITNNVLGNIYGFNDPTNPGSETQLDMEYLSSMSSGVATDYINSQQITEAAVGATTFQLSSLDCRPNSLQIFVQQKLHNQHQMLQGR